VPARGRPALGTRHVVATVVVGSLALALALLGDWLILQPADHGAWADVVRSTVLALGLIGAVPAAYVAYRRQQTTEAEHRLDERKEHQRQAELDDANERAAAKDFRDRYTAAAAQIGSDKAPIRFAGVHALAQLADEWGRTEIDQRQTCIDVLCSYLRMPWPLKAPDDATEQEKLDKNRLRDEETRVRETILRVISAHLHKDRAAESGWHQNDFDFTGAELPAVRMPHIRLKGAFNATDATFSGIARFDGATFSGIARFDGATFSGVAWFKEAVFSGIARFDGARFSGDAQFKEATFSGMARFERATFSGDAGFERAMFSGDAGFREAVFSRVAWFIGATFSGDAGFERAMFSGDAGAARFREAMFSGIARFDGATFYYAGFEWAVFSGAAGFREAVFSGDAAFDASTFASQAGFDRATFSGIASFGCARFSGDAGFSRATFSGHAGFNEVVFSGYAARFDEATFTNQPNVEEATISGLLIRTDCSREDPSDQPRPFQPLAADTAGGPE